MKKLIISLIVVSVAIVGLHAQEGGTAIVLLNYNTVKKKVEKSNEEIQDPKKNIKPATWVKRGELFQQVFMVGLEQLQEGMSSTTVVLFYKEPLSIDNETKDGALYETYNYEHMKYTFVNGALQEWERIDPIVEDPLRVAMDAYQKALELDESGKVGPKVKEQLIELKLQLKREGVNCYYTSDFDGALNDFENVLEINNMDLFAGEMDTIMVQYSGIISREIAGKTDKKELYKKAIKYYQQLADVNYGGPNTYLQMKMDYFALGDTMKGIECLKEAYEKYPDSVNVIANIADAYILAKQFDEGIEFMAKVIENNPSIPEAYYWNGRLLINKEDIEYIERAIVSYNKAAELNPDLYYIWYDVGYIYYLQGADFYDRGGLEEHEPTRDALLALGKEKYDMAISSLEKAYMLNDENPSVKYETLDILQRMYYKEQRMDDYERVKALKAAM
ncbi:MAG: tetratricopeptide repeat protein [Bacteroidota bacterium]